MKLYGKNKIRILKMLKKNMDNKNEQSDNLKN